MKSSFDLPVKIVLAYVFFILMAFLFLSHPHWGLMDDSYISSVMVKQVQQDGLLATIRNFTYSDMTSWGMFRPLYPLMAYYLYLPGVMFSPVFTFLLNILFSLGVLVYCCKVLSEILRLRFIYLLLALSAFFYQYDLFQHPSLQEKLVMLVGAAFIQVCWHLPREKKGMYYFLLFFLLLLGAGTKASFVIYFSIGFWAYFARRKDSLFSQKSASTWLSLFLLGLAGLCLVVFFSYVSAQGQYTKQYNVNKILPNLKSKEGILFLVPLFLGLVDLLVRKMRGTLRMEEAIPCLGILAFLTVFLPWGIQAYIQSIIGPIYAALWLMIAFGLFQRIPLKLWLPPLMGLAVLVSTYRSFAMFTRLGDIGHIVHELRANAFPEVREIWVPCMEGADSFRRFVLEGGEDPKRFDVHYWDKFEGYDGKVVFYDTALCPLPARITEPAGCKAENLIVGRWTKSFRLSRFHCRDKS